MRKTISERDKQILELIWEGLLNKQIAIRLNIALSTVEKERDHLYRFAGVHGIAELIRWGLTQKLISL